MMEHVAHGRTPGVLVLALVVVVDVAVSAVRIHGIKIYSSFSRGGLTGRDLDVGMLVVPTTAGNSAYTEATVFPPSHGYARPTECHFILISESSDNVGRSINT